MPDAGHVTFPADQALVWAPDGSGLLSDGSTPDPAGALERLIRALDQASAAVLRGARVEECARSGDGSAAMTGYFRGGTTLGGVALHGEPEARFLVKLSPEGEVSYTKPLGDRWRLATWLSLPPTGASRRSCARIS